MDRAPAPERRASTRTARQNRATTLIESLRRNPDEAAGHLESDLQGGAPPGTVFAVLDVAETLALLRGVNLSSTIANVKERLAQQIGGR